MPEEWRMQLETLDRPWFYRFAWGLGVILLLVFGWLYWHNYYLSPRQAFWSTIDNNLVVSGFSKHTYAKNDSGSLEQTQQVRLGAINAVRIKSEINQGSGDNTTKVVTETISTPKNNFNRYLAISAPPSQKVNFSSVLGKWGTQTIDYKTVPSNFMQSIYYNDDLVPFALLNASQRSQIVGEMKRNNVYTTDFSKAARKKQNGKDVYEYNVNVAPAAFIAIVKQIDQYSGINGLKELKASDYAGAGAVPITISIDPVARQVVRIVSNGSGKDFSAFGAHPRLDIPTSTLSQTDLQTQLTKLLSTP